MDSADEVSQRVHECGGTVDLLVDGEPMAGIRCGTAPGRPHWQVHFAVTDADLTARQAVGLGGQVLDGPEETRTVGRPGSPIRGEGGSPSSRWADAGAAAHSLDTIARASVSRWSRI
ncbi:VOC family protein [Streptomyces sp. 147326]|uniref:VOC family protein n=1 Tax=Streptomyces sp. 147326 TaxID=3074379 RepID=UPI00385789DD